MPPSNRKTPHHVSLILDGNGRWATRQGKPRVFGHAEGVRVLGPIIEQASKIGIKWLSAFAFSTENWNRPLPEVRFLWNLPSEYEQKALDLFKKHDVRFMHVGFKEAIAKPALTALHNLERATASHQGMVFALVMNYGGQQDIVQAKAGALKDKDDFARHLVAGVLPPVDLLIRTGGEKRISNYLLWHLAYAELLFTDVLWPDYSPQAFMDNIEEYWQRERRFGRINAAG